ncbi:MAG: AmmeMemoRadiSam system protein A [Verrucomicrobiota bacterium]|jgi:AmmeMemoRadiSam system protein A
MPSTHKSLTHAEAQGLLAVARRAIQAKIEGVPLEVEPGSTPDALQVRRPPFVTLHKHGELRGCVGALEARESLLAEVIRLAPAAARDIRFDRITLEELPDIHISISVLTAAVPLPFTSDEDLAEKLRPGIDGLILEEGTKRGTLLPVVWESLPDPGAFIRGTKQKAGLPPDYSSPTLEAWVYQAEEWSESLEA